MRSDAPWQQRARGSAGEVAEARSTEEQEEWMSSQPRPGEHGRSTKVVIIEIILLVTIPTLLIWGISKIWK
jgi:hypothetical protein